MAYQLKYQLEVKNFEQQLVKALIEDTFSPDTNQYGITWSRTDDPGPNQTVTVAWTSEPSSLIGVRIDALDSNGGLVGSSGTLPLSSPATWNSCPDGNHTFLFAFVASSGSDTIIVLNELEGGIIDLIPSNNPFSLITDNFSDDKLGGLAGHQLVMAFKSDSENNLNKLLRGQYSDRRYRVTATINDRTFFRGFLQMADAQEAFLPNPNEILLTATCGLSSLKNKPLQDFTGAVPSGHYTIMKYVAWCLKQTGIQGNINVSFRVKETDFSQFANEAVFTAADTIQLNNCSKNLYAGQKLIFSNTVNNNGTFTIATVTPSGSNLILTVLETVVTESLVMAQIEFLNNNWFNTIYLFAKTFEDEPGTREDCYTVLQKIAKMYFRIGQRHGQWWVKCIDEYDGGSEIVTVFDENGDWVEVKAAATYLKNIGISENMKWSGHSALVGFTSPAKFGKLTYRYENPAEIPCNIDFERGDELPGGTADEKHYDVECWDKLVSNPSSDDPTGTDIYIRRLFINGIENERAVVIEADGNFNFIMSELIPVEVKAKFNLDVRRRMATDASGTGAYFDRHVQVRLYGEDGTYWTHQGMSSSVASPDVRQWVQCTSTFRTNQKYFVIEGTKDEDQRDARSIYDGESAEIPVAGKIRILVYCSALFGNAIDTIIDKVSFDYWPFINGSHRKFTGQSHKLSRTADDIEQVDDQVHISDSPAKIMKGALMKYNGSDYELSELFWNQKVRENPLDSTETKPFGWMQAQAVWNQVRNLQRIFRGRIQGIESESVDGEDRCDLPSVFHSYALTDTDEQTTGKIFMLLSFDMNLMACEFSQITLKEAPVEKVYTDDYEFKYLTK